MTSEHWKHLNGMQLGKYAEYLVKMEFLKHGIDVFHNLFKYIDRLGKEGEIYFNVNEYGREDISPYDLKYMNRLTKAFIECSSIDVSEILKQYATI